MKTFVLIPPQSMEAFEVTPLVAVDDESFADRSPIIEHYEVYLYSDSDLASVEAMDVKQTFEDGQGWEWTRIS